VVSERKRFETLLVSIQIPRFGKVLKQVVKKSGARNNKSGIDIHCSSKII
jgi:hypothetical protein